MTLAIRSISRAQSAVSRFALLALAASALLPGGAAKDERAIRWAHNVLLTSMALLTVALVVSAT
jgi:hypothetical protein